MQKNTTHGFFLIDKPQNITSHDVVGIIRRLTGIRRVGHTGTLDPLATGALLVVVGSATRLIPYAPHEPKTYEATIILGATTDTDDLQGKQTATYPSKQPSKEEVEKTLSTFIGPIDQIPPQYAAIKVKGKKLYEYARAGETIERQPRSVTIHNLELIEYEYPSLSITATVSSGTYIRALARDIGEQLHTGGYIAVLRRTKIHDWLVKNCVKVEDIKPENWTTHLHPTIELVKHLPQIILDNSNVAKFQQGIGVSVNLPTNQLTSDQPVATLDSQNNLLGIGLYDPLSAILSPKTVLTF